MQVSRGFTPNGRCHKLQYCYQVPTHVHVVPAIPSGLSSWQQQLMSSQCPNSAASLWLTKHNICNDPSVLLLRSRQCIFLPFLFPPFFAFKKIRSTKVKKRGLTARKNRGGRTKNGVQQSGKLNSRASLQQKK